MGLRSIKKDLKDNYISDDLTEKEFEKLFKETMNSEYVKNYIESTFHDKISLYFDKRALKEMEEE